MRAPLRLGAIAAAVTLAAALLPAGPAAGGPGPGHRVLIVVEERIDERVVGATAEPALARRFLAAGFQVVERTQAGDVSRIPLERLLRGDVSRSEVSALNADLLVVGRVELRQEPMPYGIKDRAYSGSIVVRALQVDSGRVVYAGQRTVEKTGDPAQVAAGLADAIFAEMLPRVRDGLEARAVIELRIAGLRSADDADALAARLAASPGVQGARVRLVSAEATVIDLEAPGLEARALGPILGAAGLKVTRRSANVIEAGLDEVAAARRSIVVAAFKNATGRAGRDWIAAVGPDIVETELAGSRYLTPRVLPARPAADPTAAVAATRQAGADAVVVVTIEQPRSQLRLVARAIAAGDGSLLAAAEVFGTEDRALELVKDLAWKIDRLLYQRSNPGSSLVGYETRAPQHAPAGVAAPAAAAPAAAGPRPDAARAAPEPARVVLADARVEPIFPALLGRYAEHPLGEVTLQNVGGRPATAVRVAVSVEELAGRAQVLRAGDLAPGAVARVPLRLAFDRTRLLAVTQRRPVRLEIEVRYADGGEEATDTVTETTVLHDRNAMDWARADAVAAFVTHRDPVVGAFARASVTAAGDAGGTLPPALRSAAALLDTLQLLGVRYARDPSAAYGEQLVDAVQFPRETLARRTGDCDDLAVLYGALLAASGVGARLALTPGHIFVLVDSELPAAKAQALGGPARTVAFDGRAWVPIEVTRLDAGFAAAWEAGVAELGRYRDVPGRVGLVELARAWAAYPPFPVEGAAEAPKVPAGVAARVEADARSVRELDLPAGARPGAALAVGGAGGGADLQREGCAAARRGEHDRALALFAEAGKTPALAAAASNNAGNVYALIDRGAEAEAAYRRAMRGARVRAVARVNLGLLLFLRGDGKAARRELTAARSARGRELLARLGLATAPARRPPRRPAAGAPTGGDADLAWGLRAAPSRGEVLRELDWIE